MIQGSIETIDLVALGQQFERLPDLLKKQGRATAMREAFRSGRAFASQTARKEFRIRAGEFKRELTRTLLAKDGQDGSLEIKGTRINLGYFLTGAQAGNRTATGRKKKGIRLAVKKGQGTKLIQGAFTIPRNKLKSGAGFRNEAQAVFVRRKSRKGIRQLFSVSGTETIRFKGKGENLVSRHIANVFEKRLAQNYRFYESQILAGKGIGRAGKIYTFK